MQWDRYTQFDLPPAAGNQRKRFLRAMSRIQPGRLCVSSSAVGAGRAPCSSWAATGW